MDGTGFLKTVRVGGFDKKDVLAYVDELNSKIYALEAELDEKKALLEGSGGGGESSEKYEELLAADKSRITELQTNNDSLKLQMKSMEDELAEKDKEIEECRAQIAELEDQLQDAKNKAAPAPGGDNSALDLSNVFIEAQKTANTIVTQAKENARKMDEDAKKLANQVVDDANGKASTIVKNADEKASRILSDAPKCARLPIRSEKKLRTRSPRSTRTLLSLEKFWKCSPTKASEDSRQQRNRSTTLRTLSERASLRLSSPRLRLRLPLLPRPLLHRSPRHRIPLPPRMLFRSPQSPRLQALI